MLAANNWLGREIVIQLATTAIVAVSCLVGLRWGLRGVAFGLLIAWGYGSLQLFVLCLRCIGGSFGKLLRSLAPGLMLNACMSLALLAGHEVLARHLDTSRSAVYLLAMSAIGALTYAACFLFLPIKAIESESLRWRTLLLRRFR